MLKIREIREEKGLTQKELAEKLGVDGHNVGDWERGKCEPSASMLIRLSFALEVSVDYLIGREDEFGNVVATQSNVTEKEERLLRAFNTLSDLEQDKLIADAEFYSLRHRKFDPIKK